MVARGDEPGEFPGSGHVGPFTDQGEVVVRHVDRDILQAADAEQRRGGLERAGTEALQRSLDGGHVVRGRSAAAACDVQITSLRHFPHGCRHLGWQFVILSHRIGQSRVRIADDRYLAELRRVFNQRDQFCRTQRAVQTECRKGIMPDCAIEGFQGLSCQRTAGPVCRRHGNDDGKAIRGLGNGEQGGFGIERVDTGLDEQEVHTFFDEGFHLFEINGGQLVESKGAGGGISHICAETE